MAQSTPIIINDETKAEREGYKDGFSNRSRPKTMTGNLANLSEVYFWAFIKGQTERKNIKLRTLQTM
ncbi:MAG: hypothetical protein QM500_04505 [Methylococcales bacterium]